jgi:hypothetical protein
MNSLPDLKYVSIAQRTQERHVKTTPPLYSVYAFYNATIF